MKIFLLCISMFEEFGKVFEDMNPMKALKEQADGVIGQAKDQIKSLGDSITSKLKLSFLGKFEPFIKDWKEKNANNPAIDFFLSPIDDSIQNTKDDAAAKSIGKTMEDKTLTLDDVIAAQFPNEDKKNAIFKKFALNEIDPKNIPLGTGVAIRQSYIAKLLKKDTPFMSEYLRTTSMVQFIPDPTIKKITVLHPKVNPLSTQESELYERQEVSGKLEFVNAKGGILKLNEVAGFKIEEKDTGEKVKDAEVNKKVDETKRIVENEVSGGESLDSDAARLVYKTYKSINTKMLKHSITSACYDTAEALMKKLTGEELRPKKAIFSNSNATPEMLARNSIPKKIKELQLQPGTVFWIKHKPGTNDPTSQLAESGNHWCTYVGNGPNGEPKLVDQGSDGGTENTKPLHSARDVEYESQYKGGRYLHEIYVPDKNKMATKVAEFAKKNGTVVAGKPTSANEAPLVEKFEKEILHDTAGNTRAWKDIQADILNKPEWHSAYLAWHKKMDEAAAKGEKQLFSDIPADQVKKTQESLDKFGVKVFTTNTYKENGKIPYKNYGNTKYGENIFKKPIGIVTHFTAGNSVSGALNLWNGTGAKNTSVHYIVDKKGDIVQLGADGRIVKGAGGDHPPRFYNAAFIQIEVVANTYNEINPQQMKALLALESAKAKQYSIPKTNIVGHGEIEEHGHQAHGEKNERTDFTLAQMQKLRSDIDTYMT